MSTPQSPRAPHDVSPWRELIRPELTGRVDDAPRQRELVGRRRSAVSPIDLYGGHDQSVGRGSFGGAVELHAPADARTREERHSQARHIAIFD